MRDLTKVLSDAETIKLRALLAQTPEFPAGEALDLEYPKMLFHPHYLELYRLVKSHPDPLVKKEAQEKMRTVIVVVHDIEVEEEYLADGWKTQPADLMVAAGEADPRIPIGREGRRAEKQTQASREIELRQLRRRLAELTGVPYTEPASVPVAAAAASAPVAATASRPPKAQAKGSSKRERVAAATRRAIGNSASIQA